jgi:hypothetical protein
MIDQRTLVRGWGRMWAVVLLLALPLSPGREVAAQDMVSITGQVVDVVTRDPIPGVAVTVASRGLSFQPGFQLETNVEGEFQVPSIAVGLYRLELSHPLYNPAVGDFTVMRAGGFVTTMQPVGEGEGELVTGIVGVLTDAETGDLLSGVAVRTGHGQRGTLTGLRGEFLIDELIPGQHVIEFSMIGYAPRADTIRVTAGRVTNARVSLSVDPVELEPINVSVERREVKLQEVGFYHRRHTGFGKYIDRQEIENRGSMEVTDLFTGMPGVEVYPDPFNGLEKYIVLRTGRLPFPTPGLADGAPGYDRCFPRVYIDNLLTAHGGDEPAGLDNFVNTMSIAGIEIYVSTAGLPPQYSGGGSFCGVILIWTRVTGTRNQPGLRG